MNRSDAIILINRESGFGPYEITGIGLLEATNQSAAIRWSAATGGRSTTNQDALKWELLGLIYSILITGWQ
jgi:hypothetical protein